MRTKCVTWSVASIIIYYHAIIHASPLLWRRWLKKGFFLISFYNHGFLLVLWLEMLRCAALLRIAPPVPMLPELVSPAVARMLLFVMSIPFASNPSIFEALITSCFGKLQKILEHLCVDTRSQSEIFH